MEMRERERERERKAPRPVCLNRTRKYSNIRQASEKKREKKGEPLCCWYVGNKWAWSHSRNENFRSGVPPSDRRVVTTHTHTHTLSLSLFIRLVLISGQSIVGRNEMEMEMETRKPSPIGWSVWQKISPNLSQMFIMMIQEEKSKGQPEKNNSSLPFPSLPFPSSQSVWLLSILHGTGTLFHWYRK